MTVSDFDRWVGANVQTGAELPVSESERRELDDRLREDDEHPEGTVSWQEARARLRTGR